MQKMAVAIYGAPGAGKGTQADFLANQKGFIHFDTGKRLRAILYDPGNKKNKKIQAERKINEDGVLNTPSWVLKIVKEGMAKTANAGLGIVFSGSPRTMYEAFGDKKTTGLATELIKNYGKKNVFFIELQVRPEIAKNRNSIRLICKECKTGVSGKTPIQECPICLGKMERRKDDNPEIYAKRITEYNERTKPILTELKKRGFTVLKISGEKKPYEVFAEIEKKLAQAQK